MHAPVRDDARTFDEFLERSRETPIYVVLGVQGAGTNLLGRLLTKLFNFSVMRDRAMAFNAAVRLGRSPSAEAIEREIREFERIVSPSTLRRKTSKFIIQRGGPLKGLPAALRRAKIRNGADFARVIYTYRAFTRGSSLIGIKSDDIWENLHLLDQVIPNHRIILLTRDFRDNLLSVSGKHFGPVEPLCAARYVDQQFTHYAAAYRNAGPRACHITFETLLNSTRDCVDALTRQFGLTPTVDLDVAIPALKFRPNKIGKWKRLSAQELAWCEGILGKHLMDFGYPLASDSPGEPPWQKMAAATARDTVKRVPQRLRGFARRLTR